jgi:hypothetical protein
MSPPPQKKKKKNPLACIIIKVKNDLTMSTDINFENEVGPGRVK